MARKEKRSKSSQRETIRKSELQRNVFIALALIAVLFLFLRFRFFTSPLTDFHWQRQIDTAAIARNFYEEGMNIFYPRVDWRGITPGYVEMEFPLYPYLIALLYHIFGVNDLLGRLVSIAFACGTFVFIYLLTRRMFGELPALFAVALFSFAPLAVYFTRTFQPESMYLFFATAAVYFYYRFLESDRNAYAVYATVFLAVAGLLKIAIFVALFFIFLGMGLAQRGIRMFADYRIWGIALLSVIPAVLWHFHAVQLYEQTHLSFSRWLMRREAFFSLERFFDPKYLRFVFTDRFVADLTTPGFLVAAAGTATAFFRKNARVVLWAVAGFIIYFFLFMQANYAHHYYQLIGMIAACLAAAAFGDWLISNKWVETRKFTVAAVALVVLLVSGTFFYFQTTKRWYLRMDHFIEAGEALKAVSQPDDLVITYNTFGVPEILYYAHRKGWNISFVPTPEKIEGYASKGAKYLCVFAATKNETTYTDLREALIQLQSHYPVLYAQGYTVIFKLAD